MRPERVLAIFLAFLALLAGPASAAPAFDASGCVSAFSPDEDYFPVKSTVAFADNFSVAYFGSYKIVTVNRPYPGGNAEHYVLVQCGTTEPALGPDYADAPRITIPVHSLFSDSTAQGPALVTVGGLDALTGVARLDFIATPEVIAHMETAGVVEYARSGVMDIEAILAARPDVFMAGGSGETDVQRLAAAGIAVVNFTDWQETTPLGRAEWVKFMALFFNAEDKADRSFAEVADNYAAAKTLVADIATDEKPWVLSGQAFGGMFFAAGGQSFIARLIADAGGRYVFADNGSTGSFEIHDPEILLSKAQKAMVWIQAAMTYRTLADIVAEDPRLAQLPAAQAGQVWIPDALKGPNGGVQFYELGSMRPDLVLKDLISILHPEKMTGYTRVFNRAISRD